MRLVADAEIEGREPHLLGLVDAVDGLVGGEDDIQGLGARPEARGYRPGVSGRGEGDVEKGLADVVLSHRGGRGVRADDVGVELAAYLVGPLAHGLGHERD